MTCEDAISREALLQKCIYAPIAPIVKGEDVHYEDVVFAKEIINAEPVYPKQVECEDAISRSHLLSEIASLKKSPWYNAEPGATIRKEAVEMAEDLCIKKEPSVYSKQKAGHWNRLKVVSMPYAYAYECSACREWGNIQTFNANYCPNCGAKMEGKQ